MPALPQWDVARLERDLTPEYRRMLELASRAAGVPWQQVPELVRFTAKLLVRDLAMSLIAGGRRNISAWEEAEADYRLPGPDGLDVLGARAVYKAIATWARPTSPPDADQLEEAA
jgi:hypothetical protein